MAGNPPTSPLVNAAARPVIDIAPHIANNEPRHLVAACRETRSMKRAREDEHSIKYARAQLRKQTVASELPSSVYHAVGTPLWAITWQGDLRADVRGFINALRQDFRAEALRR